MAASQLGLGSRNSHMPSNQKPLFGRSAAKIGEDTHLNDLRLQIPSHLLYTLLCRGACSSSFLAGYFPLVTLQLAAARSFPPFASEIGCFSFADLYQASTSADSNVDNVDPQCKRFTREMPQRTVHVLKCGHCR